jgi:UDP-N-acetylglucosamine transferase subunit ALG13
MIFVTVGTAVKGLEFTRLLETMDRLAGELKLDVLLQCGSSPYAPKNARFVHFLSYNEALEQFRQCDLVVGHCGAGTILNALRFGKPMILLPRRPGQGEVVDDHQMELAAELSKMEGVWVAYEVSELDGVLRRALERLPVKSKPTSARQELLAAIAEFVEQSTPAGKR